MDKERIYKAQGLAPKRNSKPFQQKTSGAVTTISFGEQEYQVINVRDYMQLRNEMDLMARQVRQTQDELIVVRNALRQAQQKINEMNQQQRRSNPWEL